MEHRKEAFVPLTDNSLNITEKVFSVQYAIIFAIVWIFALGAAFIGGENYGFLAALVSTLIFLFFEIRFIKRNNMTWGKTLQLNLFFFIYVFATVFALFAVYEVLDQFHRRYIHADGLGAVFHILLPAGVVIFIILALSFGSFATTFFRRTNFNKVLKLIIFIVLVVIPLIPLFILVDYLMFGLIF